MMDDLDDLLAAAAARRPEPSAPLLARIEADALREQPRPAAQAPVSPPRRRFGFGLLVQGLGGGGGVAGLTLAAASGLWLGVAQPAVLSGWTDYLTGSTGVQLLPSEGQLLGE